MPYCAVPCCASSCQSRSWQRELRRGKTVSCVQILHSRKCKCESGEAAGRRYEGCHSSEGARVDSSSLPLEGEQCSWSRCLRGGDLQPLWAQIEWFLNMILATECRPRARCTSRVLSLANTFCLSVLEQNREHCMMPHQPSSLFLLHLVSPACSFSRVNPSLPAHSPFNRTQIPVVALFPEHPLSCCSLGRLTVPNAVWSCLSHLGPAF